MSKSAYELFRDREHPHQKELENFANRCNDTSNNEYWFRAGFITREYAPKDGWLLVRKNDINLDWYRRIKAEISEEK